MDLARIWAESYVLHCIGEFDEEMQQRLQSAFPEAPPGSALDIVSEFEAFQSVTVDQVEWIKSTWSETQELDPQEDPRRFAAEVAPEVFPDLWEENTGGD